MNEAFDLTSVRRTLRHGVEQGLWTIEQLDTPSPGWEVNAKTFRVNHPLYARHEYRNLLRDPAPIEAVQPTSSRDITPASGPTPAEQPPFPVTLEVDHAPTPTIDADLDDLPF